VLEDGHIATLPKQDANVVAMSLGAVVFFELVAQTASLHANNGINSGIKRLAPVKHFESDGVFLEPMGLPE
jgi:hypothetical protein